MFKRNEKEKDVFEMEYLTTKEAAWYLRITPNAVRIMAHRKKLKAHKLGNRLRFKRSDLKSLMQEKVID
ncbi:MAG: helix-turn-helix domain-containing protein [Bacteriovoracales bacterium]|nr:helix-turn-helix domain-containing protein [Bacteriovoracales bacterium]